MEQLILSIPPKIATLVKFPKISFLEQIETVVKVFKKLIAKTETPSGYKLRQFNVCQSVKAELSLISPACYYAYLYL